MTGQRVELLDAGLDVVAQRPFAGRDGGQVDVAEHPLVVGDHFLGNGHTQLRLCPQHGQPQPPLRDDLGLRRPNPDHVRAGVAVGQHVRDAHRHTAYGQRHGWSRQALVGTARLVDEAANNLQMQLYFVGVDLAWGERNPTGVAAIDPHGRLVHVGAFRDDAGVLAAVRPYVQGDCLVAFDAPLVVTNSTGQRPAETALNRDFRRFEAGAHPANTGKPEFADVPRAARLAEALELDMDPRSPARGAPSRSTPTRRRWRCSGCHAR